MSAIVALLLDDAMPPERLGELLRAARKRKGWKRKHAAELVGTKTSRLREYEQGTKTIPADICAQLADLYGSDLAAHVPMRVPPQINRDWLVVEEHRLPRVQGTTDEVVQEYAQIVSRLRGAQPGEAVPLRASDLAVLGSALESDPAVIAVRIAEILHCSVEEARSLHREMLRRKVVLPVAGLAASAIALAGAHTAYASQSPSQPPATPPPAVERVVATPTTHAPAPPTTVHIAWTTPPVTEAAPAPAPSPAPAPKVASVPAEQPPEDVPVAQTPPSIAPDDAPVSVLPGETPVTIIGTSITTTEPTTPDNG
jgi:transcriptional regulator with XRE-family HTH domain